MIDVFLSDVSLEVVQHCLLAHMLTYPVASDRIVMPPGAMPLLPFWVEAGARATVSRGAPLCQIRPGRCLRMYVASLRARRLRLRLRDAPGPASSQSPAPRPAGAAPGCCLREPPLRSPRRRLARRIWRGLAGWVGAGYRGRPGPAAARPIARDRDAQHGTGGRGGRGAVAADAARQHERLDRRGDGLWPGVRGGGWVRPPPPEPPPCCGGERRRGIYSPSLSQWGGG